LALLTDETPPMLRYLGPTAFLTLAVGLQLGLAQTPEGAEKLKKPAEKPADPVPVGPVELPSCLPGWPECGCGKTRTKFKIEYILEQQVTKPVLELKPGCTVIQQKTEYKIVPSHTEQRCKTEFVMEPKEVVKEVRICTYKPIKTIDPCTGCMKIHLEPVFDVKIVKETVFVLCPKTKIETYQKSCLVPEIKTEIYQKARLECSTKTETYNKGILIPTHETERVLIPADKCCTPK
jgi:hypothetical protein